MMTRAHQLGSAPAVVLLLAVCGFYAGSLDNAFQYDDIHSLVENPHIRDLRNIPDFFHRPELFSEDPKGGMFRPLVLVSYALNHAVGADRVEGYHLVNLLVHAVNALLVFALARALGGSHTNAFLAGLLFGLHPINSEAVNYVSSRSESLCALFVLTSVLGYVRHRQPACLHRYWGLVSLVSFAAALLCKSVGIVVPGLLVLYELLLTEPAPRRRRLGDICRRHWPYWLVALAYLGAVSHLLAVALVDSPVRSPGIQLVTQAKALVYYLKLLMLPHGLNVEHQFVLAAGPLDTPVLGALLFLAAGAGMLFRGGAGARDRTFWALWALMTLLPVLLIPLNVLVNEHRLYLPAVGFSILMGQALAGLLARRRAVGVVVAVAWLASCGLLARQRTQVWQSHETLWRDALAKAPLMPRPHLYMGDYHLSQGEYLLALQEYGTALTVYPRVLSGGDLRAIYNNTGSTYLAMGRPAQAMAAYRKALAVDSTYVRSREALDALEALQEVAGDPQAAALHRQGLALLTQGRLDEAVEHLRGAAEIQAAPDFCLALGLAYERQENWPAARQAYETVAALAPGTNYARTAAGKLGALRERLRTLDQTGR